MSITTSERLNYWQQQIEDWITSGLSAPKFCQSNDLTYHCFVYWRRKLDPKKSAHCPDISASGFVQASSVSPIKNELVLSLPNGVLLKGITTDNIAVVRQLLEVL